MPALSHTMPHQPDFLRPAVRRTATRHRSIMASAQQQRSATSTPLPYTPPAPVNDASLRRYSSLLPPFFNRHTILETYADGLWGLVQPLDLRALGLVDIGLRSVVVRLGDGSLLLHNPVAPTEELLRILQSLDAPVRHVLVSSNSPEHWLYARDTMTRFPDAQLWVAPGLFEPLLSRVLGPLGLNSLKASAQELQEGPGPLFDEVQLVRFQTPLTLESAVVLLRYRALLVSDAAIYLDVPANAAVQAGAEAAGIWQRLGPVTPQLFEQYPEVRLGMDIKQPIPDVASQEGARFVEAVQECPFDMVIPAHGQAPVSDGQLAWRRCFAFVAQ